MAALRDKAAEVDCKKAGKLVKDIAAVPKDVTKCVIKEFVMKCQELHQVAFLQWRAAFSRRPRHLYTNELLLISKLAARLKAFLDPDRVTGKIVTARAAELPFQFYVNFHEVMVPCTQFQISCCDQIQLFDPFPQETTMFRAPRSRQDLVYHPSRFSKTAPPSCIFFPSRRLMFKFMRACVGVR